MAKNPYYSGPTSDHFDGTRFFIKDITRDKTAEEILRWRFQSKRARWPKSTNGARFDQPPQRVEGSRLRVTYIGHASLLLQTRGINILVDPVWSQRASPLQFAGPKRVNQPGVKFEDLPPIDVVLISHNHYDHMDLATMSKLARVHAPRVITPLGNDVILRGHDKHIAAEAWDWGARIPISGDLSVTLAPAYHWSARGLRDARMALWCAFLIDTPEGSIYHIADTGWGNGAIFSQVRQRGKSVRLAVLPIGAYEPRWFMRDQHVDPEESVRIFQMCGAQNALAHHWGTFQLTDEPIDEPPCRLRAALAQGGIDEQRFRVLMPGAVWEVPELEILERAK